MDRLCAKWKMDSKNVKTESSYKPVKDFKRDVQKFMDADIDKILKDASDEILAECERLFGESGGQGISHQDLMNVL